MALAEDTIVREGVVVVCFYAGAVFTVEQVLKDEWLEPHVSISMLPSYLCTIGSMMQLLHTIDQFPRQLRCEATGVEMGYLPNRYLGTPQHFSNIRAGLL